MLTVKQDFVSWTNGVCLKLAEFGTFAERLVPWGFPWYLWWIKGYAPEQAAGDAFMLSSNYAPNDPAMLDLREGWKAASRQVKAS